MNKNMSGGYCLYWNKQLYCFLDCLEYKNAKAKTVIKTDDYFCSFKEKSSS